LCRTRTCAHYTTSSSILLFHIGPPSRDSKICSGANFFGLLMVVLVIWRTCRRSGPPNQRSMTKPLVLGSPRRYLPLCFRVCCAIWQPIPSSFHAMAENGRDIIPHFPCVDLIQGVKRVRAASPWSECYLKRAMIWAYAVKAHGNAPAVPGQDAFTRPELFCTDMY
jgi:hypothetical protein